MMLMIDGGNLHCVAEHTLHGNVLIVGFIVGFITTSSSLRRVVPVVYQRQIILTDRAFPVVAARLEYTSGYGVWQNFLNVPAPSTDSEHAVAQGVLRR